MNEVVSLAALNGLSTGWVMPFVTEIASRQSFNPIGEWIRSAPWDGKDRLPAFYASVTVQEGYPEDLKRILMYRWALSATAAALKADRFKTRGVLTFQGAQGIGKTSWIESLLPAGMTGEYIKLDHHLDGSNKDSITGAIGHWIVEIGELDSSFRKDVARLKGFLTSPVDKIRRPYAREEAEYPRCTVFTATVNERNFLVDATGNNRWWTIAAEDLDAEHGVDMQQLYAQLAVDFAVGVKWWLTDEEEAMLDAYNKQHRATSAIGEMVMDYIDLDQIGSGRGDYRTASEVLVGIGISKPSNPQSKECASILRDLLGESKRVKGRDRWRVPTRPAWSQPKAEQKYNPADDPDHPDNVF